jgi:hypothetical protein
VRRDPLSSDLRSLIDAPSPATLTLYREDGKAITSPLWFRLEGDDFEVVVAATDHKLDHLRRDPRCLGLLPDAPTPTSIGGRPAT